MDGAIVSYEVEQKFPVDNLAAVERKLGSRGAQIGPRVVEVDRYFNHPARDFAETDEAVRIRRKGEEHFITYKGPKIDQTTKTRREIELALADDPSPGDKSTVEAWSELLTSLGFRVVAEVRKTRRRAEVEHEGRTVEATLDEVDGLGEFVELELVAEEDGLDAARACLASLAESLGLAGSERRSYLELLLARRM
jgi:adenylate cyclase, class 2